MRMSALVLVIALLSGSVPATQQEGLSNGGIWDVVVIGAGAGGLAAAARLAQAGLKVVVLEQHLKVGGYMTSFKRGDYTFEVSLHAVPGFNQEMGGSKPLFRELGIFDRVEPLKIGVPYRIVFPNFEMEVPADPDLYRARLRQYFPREAQGIDRLFNMLEDVEGLMHAQLGLAGSEVGDDLEWPFQKYAGSSAAAMLSDYIEEERLLSVFSWLRLYCGTSLEELPATLLLGMWAAYHFDGYYYFAGGSQAVSNALADVIREHGGSIKLSQLVTKVVIKEGRAVAVVTKDGTEYPCHYVVSNASAPATLNDLVGREHLPHQYLGRLDQMEIGPSILQVYLGVGHDYRKLFRKAHAISVFETSDYHAETRHWKEGNVENVSFIIVNYSITDPGAAPAGKNVIVFTTYMPYDWKDGWYKSVSYAKYHALKEKVASVLIRRAEKILPDLGSHIEVMEVGSPQTMEHYTLNPKGAVYGWAVDMKHFGEGRLAQETPIPNLFLAGVWTRSGHGQISALSSGNQAAERIIELYRESKSVHMRPASEGDQPGALETGHGDED